MSWTEEHLSSLPVRGGFRLRGLEMTRLETFVDAAFAFAMTMIVISLSEIPGDFQELVTALKGVPAFAASFILIMMVWLGHRNWSRFYGLENRRTIALSLGLIFIMLVYVYPLKLVASSFFSWISGGWLPSEFAIYTQADLTGLFVIFGTGYAAMATLLALLYRCARAETDALALNPLEQIKTDALTASWMMQAAVSLTSAAFAGFLPAGIGIWAGFVYWLLPMLSPMISRRYRKKAKAVGAV